jgi:uncharacterized protein
MRAPVMALVSLAPALALGAACAAAPAVPAKLAAASGGGGHGGAPHEAPAWERFGRESFERAQREGRLIVVTVGTQWCHWCHVMDEETWSDAEVRALLDARFVAIREDADARPDLAERYAAWGWPAIALLSPEGAPITELRGFQSKARFLPLLQALVGKLDRGEAIARIEEVPASDPPRPLDAIQAYAHAQLDRVWDEREGGWGKVQKYPFWAPIEYHLVRGALRGDDEARARALLTLDRSRGLLDAVDGGMFQYSLDGVWTAPHYEKLAEINGANLGAFALGWLASKEERHLDAGRSIHRYLTTRLRASSGAFYANQDADLGTRGERSRLVGKAYYALPAEERRRAGEPFIDKSIYASHNGRIIAGLARFAAAIGDEAMLADAARAAEAVLGTHFDGASFSHGPLATDDGVRHLADQVAMTAALLELFGATGEALRLPPPPRASGALLALREEPSGAGGALYAHSLSPDAPPLARRTPLRANAEAARLLIKLGRLEEEPALIEAGLRALAAFAREPLVADEGRLVGEYLLALEEARAEPLHFAIVRTATAAPVVEPAAAQPAAQPAGVGGSAVRALHRAALAVYAPHRLVEILAPGGKYPDLGRPALYICGTSFCSAPITDPARVAEKAAPFLKPKSEQP